HREPDHPGLGRRDRDAVARGVRAVRGHAVIAIDAHPEHGVVDPRWVAVGDLDGRGPARLQDDALDAVVIEHPRPHDLDRPIALPAADLASSGALALLLLA